MTKEKKVEAMIDAHRKGIVRELQDIKSRLTRWVKEHQQLEVAAKGDTDGYVDVRLRYHEGSITIKTGDPQFDQDHRGFWGAGVVAPDTDVEELFKELKEELMEDVVMKEPWKKPDWTEGLHPALDNCHSYKHLAFSQRRKGMSKVENFVFDYAPEGEQTYKLFMRRLSDILKEVE